MMLHGFDFFALLMVSNGTTIRTTKASWNSLTNWAWSAMIGGNTTWNGFMWTVWLFSFIKSPFCQKAMFWSFVVGFGLNALYLVAVTSYTSSQAPKLVVTFGTTFTWP